MIFGQALVLAAALFGQDSGDLPAPAEQTEISDAKAASLIQSCGSRRFEAIANFPVEGKMRRSKVTLCASDQETKDQWIEKLEKGADQIAAHPTMNADAKAQLVAQLRGEAARVKSQGTLTALTPAPALPTGRINADDLNRDFAQLPSLPTRPSNRQATTSSPMAGYTSLPPLPAPKAATAAAVSAGSSGVKGPRFTVQCAPFGDDRGQRCGLLVPGDRMIFKAAEAFKGPVQLLFRREDDVTAEVGVTETALRVGQTRIATVPKAICAGRNATEFTVEVIVPNGNPIWAPRLGPYRTRCD